MIARILPRPWTWLCLLAVLAAGLAFAQNVGDTLLALLQADTPVEQSPLPKDAKIEQEYRFGEGEPVGAVDFVDNESYIIHPSEPGVAFRTAKNNPVFQGDTLLTMASSSLVVVLNDQSRFSMAANAKLVIDKSVYDPEKSTRDTVLELAAGKARIVARKINPYGAEDFKVRTSVATCGIRGSDFAMALTHGKGFRSRPPNVSQWLPEWLVGTAYAQANPDTLVVLTGENTSVSVTSTTGDSVVVNSNSVTGVFQGEPPTTPQSVPPETVNNNLNQVSGNVAVMKVPRIFE